MIRKTTKDKKYEDTWMGCVSRYATSLRDEKCDGENILRDEFNILLGFPRVNRTMITPQEKEIVNNVMESLYNTAGAYHKICKCNTISNKKPLNLLSIVSDSAEVQARINLFNKSNEYCNPSGMSEGLFPLITNSMEGKYLSGTTKTKIILDAYKTIEDWDQRCVCRRKEFRVYSASLGRYKK